jgi:hypothetical protein
MINGKNWLSLLCRFKKGDKVVLSPNSAPAAYLKVYSGTIFEITGYVKIGNKIFVSVLFDDGSKHPNLRLLREEWVCKIPKTKIQNKV